MNTIRLPLSEDCYSTSHLDSSNLRSEAYYFDWLIINTSTCLTLFKNDFKDYLIKENLRCIGKNKIKFKHTDIMVKDIKNNIFYLHHFNNIDLDFDKVKSMFDRRIERLNNHFKENKKVELYFKELSLKNKKIVELDSSWGINSIINGSSKIKNLLLNKYSYSNENEITIHIID